MGITGETTSTLSTWNTGLASGVNAAEAPDHPP